jgi:hypothetical protein
LIVHLQQREEQIFLLLSLLIGALTGLAVVAFIVVTERLGMRLYPEPVSRQYEDSYNGYYGFPNYLGGSYMWGGNPYMVRDRSRRGVAASEAMGWDRNLRSTREVTGYHLLALDGEIGHVDDFIIEDETWAIRYLVVATKNWWPGKKVLISPKWIESVSWDAREVVIGLTRETIKAAPEYTDESLLTRDYETGLYGYYNREGYWVDELSIV